jgi:hypothetical protein
MVVVLKGMVVTARVGVCLMYQLLLIQLPGNRRAMKDNSTPACQQQPRIQRVDSIFPLFPPWQTSSNTSPLVKKSVSRFLVVWTPARPCIG